MPARSFSDFQDQSDRQAAPRGGTMQARETENLYDELVRVAEVLRTGATADRPSSPDTGERFFDTDVGHAIHYDGNNWVDGSGATV